MELFFLLLVAVRVLICIYQEKVIPDQLLVKALETENSIFFCIYFEQLGTAQYWKLYELENFSHKPSQDTSSLVSAG